jgi:hypothetical protein
MVSHENGDAAHELALRHLVSVEHVHQLLAPKSGSCFFKWSDRNLQLLVRSKRRLRVKPIKELLRPYEEAVHTQAERIKTLEGQCAELKRQLAEARKAARSNEDSYALHTRNAEQNRRNKRD